MATDVRYGYEMDTSFLRQPHFTDPRRVYSTTSTDWRQRVDFDRMRRERLARAKAQLEEKDLGAVILFTGENVHAVVEALQSAHLNAAGLDVFGAEPPPQEFLDAAPNLIATPPTAFCSVESIRESQTKAANAIVDVLGGREPAYRVV